MRDLDSSRNEVFNTEYFKALAARPAHVKDKYCVGAMDGGQVYLNGMLELSFLSIIGLKQGNGLINTEDFYGIIWLKEVLCVKLKRRIRTVLFRSRAFTA